MANAASLSILAVVGVALALASSGESADPPGSERLDPGVAIRISAADPARTLVSSLDVGAPALDPAVAEQLRKTWAAIERAGADPAALLAPFSSLTISIEQSCPPPALLACRPGARISGLLRSAPDPEFDRELTAALVAGLRASGLQRLVVHEPPAAVGGSVSSRGETLAHWTREGRFVEVVTDGLELRPGTAAPAPQPPADHAATGAGLQVEVDPTTLAALLR